MLNVLRVSLVLLGFGLLFEAVGLACPGWLTLSVGETSMNMGLWYIVVCQSSFGGDKTSECITLSYVGLEDKAGQSLPDGSDLAIDEFVKWGAMATVSLVSALVAIVLTRNVYVQYKFTLSSDVPYFNRGQTGLAMLASCLSGILMLIPVGMFGYYNSIFRSVSTALNTSDISLGVPYGLIVGCLGACLVLLASLSLLLLICRNNGQQPPIVYAAPLGPFGGAQVQVTTGYPTTQPIGVYPPATYPNIPPPEQEQDSRNNTPFGYNRF